MDRLTLSPPPRKWLQPNRRRTDLRQLGFQILGSTLVVLALVRILVEVAYAGRIYPGVRVLGLNVGGLTEVQASSLIARRGLSYLGESLTLRAADSERQVHPADLGLRLNPDQLAHTAYQFGRAEGPTTVLLGPAIAPILATRASECDRSCGPGGTTPSVFAGMVDLTMTDSALKIVSATVDRPPRDASLTIGADVVVQPQQDGRELDIARSRQTIWSALVALRDQPIDLSVTTIPATITATELAGIRDQARASLARGYSLVDGDRAWPIPPMAIRSSLVVTGNPPALAFRPEPFGPFLDGVARDGARAPRDASIVVSGGKVVMGDEVTGRSLDRDGTLVALRNGILGPADDPNQLPGTGNRQILASWSPVRPAVSVRDLDAMASAADASIARGLVLVVGAERYSLSPNELGDAVRFRPNSSGVWSASLDESKVADLVAGLNRDYARAQPRARFSLSDGQLKLTAPVEPARSIDQKKAGDAILAGWQQGEVALPVLQSSQVYDDALLARIGGDLRDVVGEAATSYAGSIPDRAHNVELAARNLDGALLAPGQPFSFNDAIGPTTLDAGFRWGFAIQSDGQTPTTVPSVAGGICQVATTLFQPVFWAGYTIDERHWHDYWIEHYRTRGLPGLDATVDPEAGLDLKFTNDSNSYLLIHAWTDGQTLRVQLIGKRPAWRVDVSPAQLTDPVSAPLGIVRTTSTDFPTGTTVITQARADGFRVAIDRRVTYPNGQTRLLNVREQYAPAPTAVLVGSG